MVEMACAYCGKPFMADPYHVRVHGKKYCSEPCQHRGSQKRADCLCVVCGTKFSVKVYRAETAKYCSDACRVVAFSKVNIGKIPAPLSRVALSQRRRARVMALPHTLTEPEWSGILVAYNNRCAYCGKHQSELESVLEREHVIPVVQGGGYTKDNIVPSCKSCNRRKSKRTPEQANLSLQKEMVTQ